MRSEGIVGGWLRSMLTVGLVVALGLAVAPAAQAAVTPGTPEAVTGAAALDGIACTSGGCIAVGQNCRAGSEWGARAAVAWPAESTIPPPPLRWWCRSASLGPPAVFKPSPEPPGSPE